MHDISKAQNRLFNIILRIDNCLRHTFTHLAHSLSPFLYPRSCPHFAYFCRQSVSLMRQPQRTREEDTPKTNDDDNNNAAQKEARPVSCAVCMCVWVYAAVLIFRLKVCPGLWTDFFEVT